MFYLNSPYSIYDQPLTSVLTERLTEVMQRIRCRKILHAPCMIIHSNITSIFKTEIRHIKYP